MSENALNVPLCAAAIVMRCVHCILLLFNMHYTLSDMHCMQAGKSDEEAN